MGELDTQTPEFSRIVDAAGLGSGPSRHDIEAAPEERAALARRFGLERLDRLAASLSLARAPGGRIRLDGALSAALAQSCVVSLEPVAQEIEERFSLYFAPAAAAAEGSRGDDPVIGLDDEAWPEPMLDGKIDLGEAVAQQLALALDPYPRAPGARLESEYAEAGLGGELAAEPVGPFAVLANLAKRD